MEFGVPMKYSSMYMEVVHEDQWDLCVLEIMDFLILFSFSGFLFYLNFLFLQVFSSRPISRLLVFNKRVHWWVRISSREFETLNGFRVIC